MSWCGGGLISVTPAVVCRTRAISAVTLWRQLPALAGLGALGDLDLQLLGAGEVIGGDPEAPGGHLAHARAAAVPSAAGTARAGPRRLAGVGAPAPSRFMARATVSWASGLSEPMDMAEE